MSLTYKGISGNDWYVLKKDEVILSDQKSGKGVKQPALLPRGSIVASKHLKWKTRKLSVISFDYGYNNIRCNLDNLEKLYKDDLDWLLPICDPALRHHVYYNKKWWAERHYLKQNSKVTYICGNANTEGTVLKIGTPEGKENIWIELVLHEV